MLLFSDLPALLGGHLRQTPAATQPVRHLLLDSRRVGEAAGSVFFALRGPQHDGHRHLPELYAKGIRLFVVAENHPLPFPLTDFPDAGFLAVPSPLAALQALAAHHRREFAIPVLAITGSNGKTIVKEWLAQLLSPDEYICRSPRSYNSQIGVPLSVWELHAGHTLGIFEAGISEPGEMARLAAVIQPTLGIFTNLGTAHDAGFASPLDKLREKLRLFQQPGFDRLFYCRDQELVHQEVRRLGLPATFTWSRHGHPADLAIELIERRPTLQNRLLTPDLPTTLRVRQAARPDEEPLDFTVPFADEPSLENVLAGLAVLLFRNVAPAEIQLRLLRLHPVAMRLEMKPGRHDCYLLDDTYNNDLAGLTLALETLSRQARPGRRTLILSDVLESGLPAPELYARVLALLPLYGVSRLVGVGEAISAQLAMGSEQLAVNKAASPTVKAQSATESPQALITDNYSLLTDFFPTTDAFLAALQPTSFQHETILIKGARRFGFERIVAALQQQQHGTVLEVNLDALSHNLQHYRQRLSPDTKLMVMVKAFAYGSGSYEVASLLQFQRVDYLAVAYTDEGVQLRENGISLPIMVMNPAPDSFEQLRRYRLEPEIYSLDRLRDYLEAAQTDAGPTPENRLLTPPALPAMHLKLDTGMRRLGFDEADLPELTRLLTEHHAVLPVASILTHLAGADEPRLDDFTHQQLAAFRRMAAAIEAALGHAVLKHALNSAGILRFPEAHFEMVRLGIGLYGVDASGENPGALQPVSALRTTISQVKTLPAGATVGYGRRGAGTDHPRRIATLAIGYADGYDRRFGHGQGHVLIHGQPAPLVGSVCMDMCMADVTTIPEAQAGDAALIFGPGLPLPELAARIGTIAYELLTNVSERVKRVFISE